MSARRLSVVDRARADERERCIDLLLEAGAEMMALAARHPEIMASLINVATGYYSAARMLAPLSVAREWPQPSEWATWAARACGAEERS